MARYCKTYPPEIREAEGNDYLYSLWRRIRNKPHDPAWDKYKDFFAWAMSTGYFPGAVLRPGDEEKPLRTDNFIWKDPAENDYAPTPEMREWARLWTKTVNRIRVHYGMKPFPDPEEMEL